MYDIFRDVCKIHGLRCALLAPRNAWIPFSFLLDFGFAMASSYEQLHSPHWRESHAGEIRVVFLQSQGGSCGGAGLYHWHAVQGILAWRAWHFCSLRELSAEAQAATVGIWFGLFWRGRSSISARPERRLRRADSAIVAVLSEPCLARQARHFGRGELV